MSLIILLGLSAALHLYIGLRIVPALDSPWGAVLFALLLALSALLVPAGMFARRIARGRLADTVAAVGLFFMGLFSSLLVATLLRDLALLLATLLQALAPGAWPLAPLARWSARAAVLAAGAVTLLGLWNARRIARVVTVDVPVKGLPAALRGFTIVQISDVHVGPTIRQRYVEGIVEAVNRLQPDVVAITGDLVDGSVAELGGHVAPLAQLAARDGSFFVTGNHEYYSGAGPWIAELSRLGIRVLHNEHVVIQRSGAKLVLAGVPDYSGGHFDEAHRSDPLAALAGAPADAGVKVLLAHQPRSAPAAQRAGFDLQLSGHTHGGQFLPWNFFVRLQQPFTAGLHRLEQLWVYVSRGTGYWGPPKRFGAPSEITRLRLMPSV
ncbi:metallophosphoesterase [Ramlibacter solisilvae]|uniref:Serine/threonine protein phosphatase n=1 Tax=Ramlibacter tataouinensis TaxID=94132 RepID=A0A127JTJ8_9BURK|nr:metallophosphoesterase [Ramlibacter tataouinensis]AMO23358.1 serine/threonine protein phosphatase [Ramlibacter tataouinensis]